MSLNRLVFVQASIAVALGLAGEARAQAQADSPAQRAGADRLVTRAVRLHGELSLDGRLDEPAWDAAAPATGFTQSHPQPGSPASQATQARILFDDTHLYVGIRMFDTAPDSIAAPLARRDAADIHSDWVQVVIDSRLDRRTAFRFAVNPRGVRRDAYHYDDTAEDVSWVAVWDAGTRIDSLGWSAEFRIPLSQLRFDRDAAEPRTWGLQIIRDIARLNERSTWVPWTRSDAGFVSRFGLLTGFHGIRPGRGLEVIPYASSQLTRAPAAAGNPLLRTDEPAASAGADLRLGLPRGLTFSATVNPDFGQVEADPAEVNLTAFETFFQERRPFFTEGADAFRFGEPRAISQYGFLQFFYSRRIGRSPQRELVGSEYLHVDAPRQTRILGAAKVSGRTPGGWSVGLMNAVTNRERAAFIDAEGERGQTTVEPLANYFVGRLRRELRGGSTAIGGLLTATHRELDDDLAPLLHRSAYLGGADFFHGWADRAWRLSGYAAASRVAGDPAALRLTQRDAMRYYQRPDADHLSLDPDRPELGGHIAELSLVHTGRWLGSLELKQVSPGFEINDLGFLGRADSRSIVAFLGRRVDRARGLLQDQDYWISSFHAWNFGGEAILRGLSGSATVTFSNFWRAGLTAGYRPRYLNDRLTRGGPLAASPAQRELGASLVSDQRRPASLRIEGRHWGDVSGSRERTVGIGLDVRPTPALRLQLRPNLVRNERTAQFVTASADPRAASTFGTRYVFAELDQTTASLDLRLDWTFTPDLSLQLFAQPFVSAGAFDEFKEFTKSRGFAFAAYGTDRGAVCRFGAIVVASPDADAACPASLPPVDDPRFTVRFANPDFTLRSLRGNAVLRWEYRPGSTLFLVWQQDRSGFGRDGSFEFGRDASAVFREPAQHVFLVKASYWFGR